MSEGSGITDDGDDAEEDCEASQVTDALRRGVPEEAILQGYFTCAPEGKDAAGDAAVGGEVARRQMSETLSDADLQEVPLGAFVHEAEGGEERKQMMESVYGGVWYGREAGDEGACEGGENEAEAESEDEGEGEDGDGDGEGDGEDGEGGGYAYGAVDDEHQGECWGEEGEEGGGEVSSGWGQGNRVKRPRW